MSTFLKTERGSLSIGTRCWAKSRAYGTVIDKQYVGPVSTWINSRETGESYADWRSRIARGQDATTSLRGYRRHQKSRGGEVQISPKRLPPGSDYQWDAYYQGDLWSYQTYMIPTADTSTPYDLESKARSFLLKSYLAAKNTFRGGNFLAEFRETYEAFKHPLRAFYHETYDFAKHLKRLGKVYRKRKEYNQHLANAWLAWSFGVKPLVNDLNDAASAVNKLQNGFQHDVIPVKGSAYSETVVEANRLFWNPPPIGVPSYNTLYNKRTKQTWYVRYKGALCAAPEDRSLLLQQFGVDPYDILPALWEATPFSFLIDYFANVGEVLDGMRLWGVTPSWLIRTVRNTTNIKTSNLYAGDPGNFVSGVNGFECEALFTTRDRETSFPPPLIRLQVPNVTSLKWLNIGALATQFAKVRPMMR